MVRAIVSALVVFFATLALGSPPSVYFRVGELDSAAVHELDVAVFGARLRARLVNEGYSVSPADSAIVVTLDSTPETWVIQASLGAKVCERLAERRQSTQAELHLELSQKVVQLVRELDAIPAPTAPTAIMAPSSIVPLPAIGVPPLVSQSSGRRGSPVEGAAGLAALVRGPADILVTLAVRVAVWRGLGVHVSTGLTPSSTGGTKVLEWDVLAGLGYRLRVHRLLDLEIAAFGGILVLHDGANPATSFTQRGPLGALTLLADVRMSRHVGLQARVSAGVAERSPRAVDDRWSRSRYRGEFGVGLIVY